MTKSLLDKIDRILPKKRALMCDCGCGVEWPLNKTYNQSLSDCKQSLLEAIERGEFCFTPSVDEINTIIKNCDLLNKKKFNNQSKKWYSCYSEIGEALINLLKKDAK